MAASVLGKRNREQRTCRVIEPVTPSKRRVVQLQTPLTSPTKPLKSPKKVSPYSPVKSALRRSATADIVGREAEFEALDNFIDNREAGLLYICGPPGTGKSATVAQCTSRHTSTQGAELRVVNINCVSLQKPDQVYENILTELDCRGTKLAQLKDCLERLDSKGQQVLLILDEVDYLSSGNLKVIYSLFELGASLQVKIIAIANALNLTDSLLPHLRATGLTPLVLRFAPYTPAEITSILASRVSCTGTSIVEKSALDFIGRKVANATGDIRKALDILRQSIEQVESTHRSSLSTLSTNTDSRVTSVTVKDIAKVATSALNAVPTLSALGVHEKAVLCTIIVKKTDTKETTYDAYEELCRRDGLLTPLGKLEFNSVVSRLLCAGLLVHVKRKVSVGVSQMDILNSIADLGILKRFFE